jgi:hypothetical protein
LPPKHESTKEYTKKKSSVIEGKRGRRKERKTFFSVACNLWNPCRTAGRQDGPPNRTAGSRAGKKMKITYGVGAGLAPAQNPGHIPNTAGATARVAPTNRIYRRTGIEPLTRLIHVRAEAIFK